MTSSFRGTSTLLVQPYSWCAEYQRARARTRTHSPPPAHGPATEPERGALCASSQALPRKHALHATRIRGSVSLLTTRIRSSRCDDIFVHSAEGVVVRSRAETLAIKCCRRSAADPGKLPLLKCPRGAEMCAGRQVTGRVLIRARIGAGSGGSGQLDPADPRGY